MIDIHNHILPEVDDGAKSWEIALEMCLMATADGIEHMVATPHANDRYHYDREHLNGVLGQLRQRLAGTLRLGLGCDFHLSYENLQDALVHPEKYCIEDTYYLLVELSNYSIPAQINDCFAQLGDRGITPILTHPERNPILQQNMQRVIEWAQQGCVIQVTASAITGTWGERAWNAAQWLLKRDAVHVLASDAHDTKSRPPGLSAAREEIADLCGADVARALVDDNPRAIVQAKPLPYFPNPLVKS